MRVRLSLVYRGTPQLLDNAELIQEEGSEKTLLCANAQLGKRVGIMITEPDGTKKILQVDYLRYDFARKEFPCVHTVVSQKTVNK